MRKKERDYIEEVLEEHTDDKSYRRYKNRQYRNLVIKSLLSFLLGLFLAFFFKLI